MQMDDYTTRREALYAKASAVANKYHVDADYVPSMYKLRDLLQQHQDHLQQICKLKSLGWISIGEDARGCPLSLQELKKDCQSTPLLNAQQLDVKIIDKKKVAPERRFRSMGDWLVHAENRNVGIYEGLACQGQEGVIRVLRSVRALAGIGTTSGIGRTADIFCVVTLQDSAGSHLNVMVYIEVKFLIRRQEAQGLIVNTVTSKQPYPEGTPILALVLYADVDEDGEEADVYESVVLAATGTRAVRILGEMDAGHIKGDNWLYRVRQEQGPCFLDSAEDYLNAVLPVVAKQVLEDADVPLTRLQQRFAKVANMRTLADWKEIPIGFWFPIESESLLGVIAEEVAFDYGKYMGCVFRNLVASSIAACKDIVSNATVSVTVGNVHFGPVDILISLHDGPGQEPLHALLQCPTTGKVRSQDIQTGTGRIQSKRVLQWGLGAGALEQARDLCMMFYSWENSFTKNVMYLNMVLYKTPRKSGKTGTAQIGRKVSPSQRQETDCTSKYSSGGEVEQIIPVDCLQLFDVRGVAKLVKPQWALDATNFGWHVIPEHSETQCCTSTPPDHNKLEILCHCILRGAPACITARKLGRHRACLLGPRSSFAERVPWMPSRASLLSLPGDRDARQVLHHIRLPGYSRLRTPDTQP
eukprot:g41304.t1